MKSDEEIKAEARDYWSRYTDQVIALVTDLYLKTTPKSELKLGGMAYDTVIYPDFTSLELKLTDRVKWITTPRQVAVTKKILGDKILDYEKFFAGDADNLFDSIFAKGQIYTLLLESRAHAIKEHKKRREVLTRSLNSLRKFDAKKHYLAEQRDLFITSIENLEYLNKFSAAVIDYLTTEWPTSFGLGPNLDKAPAKHPIWNDIILTGYKYLRKTVSPPLSHTSSCEFLAFLFIDLFPNIWGSDDKEVTSRIRTRVDLLDPYLVTRS